MCFLPLSAYFVSFLSLFLFFPFLFCTTLFPFRGRFPFLQLFSNVCEGLDKHAIFFPSCLLFDVFDSVASFLPHTQRSPLNSNASVECEWMDGLWITVSQYLQRFVVLNNVMRQSMANFMAPSRAPYIMMRQDHNVRSWNARFSKSAWHYPGCLGTRFLDSPLYWCLPIPLISAVAEQIKGKGGVLKLGLCATLIAPSSVDAWSISGESVSLRLQKSHLSPEIYVTSS